MGLVIWLWRGSAHFKWSTTRSSEARHCISGGKYKPCSYRFVIVLIKLIFGMVKKKIKVLLRKVVKQYMGLAALDCLLRHVDRPEPQRASWASRQCINQVTL